MAINFTDSPADGATQVISGRTYTYNSAKNKWDTTATEVVGPTATTYATVNDLPTSGVLAGDQAFVSGTNRLYIWNGTGWYNIALINTTPSISGVSSSYALAVDGTPTTVTITAADPEGLPITYSIASDTSGNIATVASNNNVFTITPSTNTANAGSFSLTFRASDGVNIATALSSFTLQFAVQNSNYTTALITSVGANNAINNTFVDSSTNSHTITVAGNATQTTFSPYRHGGYSTYFDGTTDYLTVASSTEHDFGTGNFCVEFWWWPETVTGNSAGLHIALSSPANSTTQLGYDEGGRKLYFYNNDNGGNIIQNTGVTPTVKAWNHIALCRSGTTVSLYLNGTRAGTATHTSNVSFSGLQIGRYTAGGYEIDGYVRDVRLVKGSSIYDATQASLTVPTEPLTAVTNTTLLACHLPYIADGSTTGHAITVNGNTKTEPFAPYDAQEYSAADHSGSISLDGSGDSVSAAASADFGFGTGDLTVEWWINFNSISNYPYQIDMRSTGTDAPLALYTNTASGNVLGVYVNATVIATGTNAFTPGRWTHYAVCKTGGYLKGYFNGKEDFSIVCTRDYGSSEAIRVGAVFGNDNYYVDGSIADVRLVKGTAVYTSAFTPPTAPLTAITNTSLLLKGTNAGIIDKSQSSSQLILEADTKCSSTQAKYRSTAIYTDGTGDRIRFQAESSKLTSWWGVGGQPFTVEWWQYDEMPYTTNHIVGPNTGGGVGGWNTTNGHEWLTFFSGSTFYLQYFGTNNSYNTISGTPSTMGFVQNQWQHIAHTYDGTTWKFYIDGTEALSSNLPNVPQGVNVSFVTLGGMPDNSYYSATYYDDVRITKGLVRYTANFTPPTAALQG